MSVLPSCTCAQTHWCHQFIYYYIISQLAHLIRGDFEISRALFALHEQVSKGFVIDFYDGHLRGHYLCVCACVCRFQCTLIFISKLILMNTLIAMSTLIPINAFPFGYTRRPEKCSLWCLWCAFVLQRVRSGCARKRPGLTCNPVARTWTSSGGLEDS